MHLADCTRVVLQAVPSETSNGGIQSQPIAESSEHTGGIKKNNSVRGPYCHFLVRSNYSLGDKN